MKIRLLSRPRGYTTNYLEKEISRELAIKYWLNDIKILSNQVNKTKLKVSEIKNSKHWDTVVRSKSSEFAGSLQKFAKSNNFFISVISFDFSLKCSFDFGDNVHLNKIARKVGTADLTSEKYENRYPFVVISDEKLTDKNIQKAVKLVGIKKLEEEGNWETYSTTLKLRSETAEVDEFTNLTYRNYIGFLRDIEIANKNHGEKYNKAVEGSGDSAEAIGKLIGYGIVAAVIFGAVYGLSQCSTPSNQSSYSTSISKSQYEKNLRKAAEELYDKCQLYGKSYDSRC